MGSYNNVYNNAFPGKPISKHALVRKACNNTLQEIINTEIAKTVTHAHHHQLFGGDNINPLPQETIRKKKDQQIILQRIWFNFDLNTIVEYDVNISFVTGTYSWNGNRIILVVIEYFV